MKLHLAFATAALATLLTPAAAYADTLVDTGTPGGSIPWSLEPTQSLAGRFTLTGSNTITGLEGYIRDAGTVTATLYADGSTPGASLFSTSFSKGAGEGWSGASGLNWAVGPGSYWLGFASNNVMAMRNGAPAPLGGYAYSDATGWIQYNTLGIGIRVFGTPGTPGGAVPEPGTWALLLIGFGAIGAGMRAKRRQRATVRFAV